MSEFAFSHAAGIYLPEQMARRPKAVGLFVGAGGMDLGLHEAGFDVVGASEYDEWATLTYLVNLARPGVQIHGLTPDDDARLNKAVRSQWRQDRRHGRPMFMAGSGWISSRPAYERGCEHFWFGDIRGLTGERVLRDLGMERGELDLVAGGPPCQGFSTAGQRNVMDPRNSLVFEFARIIIEIQPKTMVFENVPGLVSMTTPEGIPVLDALCRVFEDGGFGAYEALRNSLLTSSGMGLASKNASGVKQLRKGRKGGNADDQDDDEFADDPAPQMEMAL